MSIFIVAQLFGKTQEEEVFIYHFQYRWSFWGFSITVESVDMEVMHMRKTAFTLVIIYSKNISFFSPPPASSLGEGQSWFAGGRMLELLLPRLLDTARILSLNTFPMPLFLAAFSSPTDQSLQVFERSACDLWVWVWPVFSCQHLFMLAIAHCGNLKSFIFPNIFSVSHHQVFEHVFTSLFLPWCLPCKSLSHSSSIPHKEVFLMKLSGHFPHASALD